MAANMDAFDLTLFNASVGRSPDRRIPQSLAVGSSINQTPIGCPLPACSSSFTLDQLPANCFYLSQNLISKFWLILYLVP